MDVIIQGSEYETMDRNLVERVEENKEQDVVGIPICSSNLSSPVFDTSIFIKEAHYKIGTWLYIENAD